MSKLFIGIGSNKGDREGFIGRALSHLKNDEEIKVLKKSTLIETEPHGKTDQGRFLNLVAEIETFQDPYTIFKRLKNIERFLGRKDGEEKWGPREIDLDILLFDDLIIKGKNLKIPHPQMHNRRFVLEPLCEIAPETLHPGFNKNARQLLEDLNNNHGTDQVAPQNQSAHSETQNTE